MKLIIARPDPFKILTSTKFVMEHAKYVKLNQQAVEEHAVKIGKYLKEHEEFPELGNRLSGDYKTDVQLIFFQSMMGFCFWAMPGEPKWTIEMPDGEMVDGWYAVCAAFQRAYDEGMPVADTNFFVKATRKDVQNIFRSTNAAEIPLLDERVKIFNENAKILKKEFDGHAINVLEQSDHDAVKLCQLVLDHFPSYRDVATYDGREVVFLKLLHLLALDFEFRLTPKEKRPFLKNFDQLCVFADYKLPQLLRMFGILEYDDHLAKMVDSYTEIAAGSEEEVEIRAGAIWGVELLRQQLPGHSSIEVGHVIWLTSQDQALQAKSKPYHRTYTTFY